MNANIRYITELTRDDLKQIAEVANIECKDGIRIQRINGKAVLSIDMDQLRCLMNEHGMI